MTASQASKSSSSPPTSPARCSLALQGPLYELGSLYQLTFLTAYTTSPLVDDYLSPQGVGQQCGAPGDNQRVVDVSRWSELLFVNPTGSHQSREPRRVRSSRKALFGLVTTLSNAFIHTGYRCPHRVKMPQFVGQCAHISEVRFSAAHFTINLPSPSYWNCDPPGRGRVNHGWSPSLTVDLKPTPTTS